MITKIRLKENGNGGDKKIFREKSGDVKWLKPIYGRTIRLSGFES